MAARLTPVAFQGRDALRLDNGMVTAHLAPEIGGRLLQFAAKTQARSTCLRTPTSASLMTDATLL